MINFNLKIKFSFISKIFSAFVKIKKLPDNKLTFPLKKNAHLSRLDSLLQFVRSGNSIKHGQVAHCDALEGEQTRVLVRYQTSHS